MVVDDGTAEPVRRAWNDSIRNGIVRETGVVTSRQCDTYVEQDYDLAGTVFTEIRGKGGGGERESPGN